MHIGPWEVLAFGGLYVAALILAADAGLRMAPDLRERLGITEVMKSGVWGFTPIILLTVSGIIFVIHTVGLLSPTQPYVRPVVGSQPTETPTVSPATRQRAVETTSPSTSATQPAQRIFVQVSPRFLSSLYQDRTSQEGDRLAQPYISKWITISGPVTNVSALEGRSLVWIERDYAKGEPHIHMVFDANSTHRTAVLRKGQLIKAVCELVGVSVATVDGRNCDFQD